LAGAETVGSPAIWLTLIVRASEALSRLLLAGDEVGGGFGGGAFEFGEDGGDLCLS
jgi:hypothetical protein